MDRSDALKLLGLSEGDQHKEIESRYFQLVKRYKYLAHDEQPSIGEPIFVVINEAYRLLIGYTPMQRIKYKELGWKEKLQYIYEYYMLQIVVCVMSVLAIVGIGFVIHHANNALHTQTTSSQIHSTEAISAPISDCNRPPEARR